MIRNPFKVQWSSPTCQKFGAFEFEPEQNSTTQWEVLMAAARERSASLRRCYYGRKNTAHCMKRWQDTSSCFASQWQTQWFTSARGNKVSAWETRQSFLCHRRHDVVWQPTAKESVSFHQKSYCWNKCLTSTVGPVTVHNEIPKSKLFLCSQ